MKTTYSTLKHFRTTEYQNSKITLIKKAKFAQKYLSNVLQSSFTKVTEFTWHN